MTIANKEAALQAAKLASADTEEGNMSNPNPNLNPTPTPTPTPATGNTLWREVHKSLMNKLIPGCVDYPNPNPNPNLILTQH